MRLFLVKHQIIIALFSSLLALLSFSLKEGFRERAKDLSSSASKAQDTHDLYLSLEQMSFTLNSISQQNYMRSASEATDIEGGFEAVDDAAMATLDNMQRYAEHFYSLAAELLDRTPQNNSQLQLESGKIRAGLPHLRDKVDQLRDADIGLKSVRRKQFGSIAAEEAAMQDIINRFNEHVLENAHHEADKLERRVANLTVATYVLFGLSWLFSILAQIFKLSGDEAVE